MNQETIQAQHKSVIRAIQARRLKDAIDQLQAGVKATFRGELIDNLYNCELTYKSMLRYNLEGFSDPDRKTIYLQIVAQLYQLADRTSDLLLEPVSNQLIYQLRHQTAPQSVESLTNHYMVQLSVLELKRIQDIQAPVDPDTQQALLALFNRIWSNPFTPETAQWIGQWFNAETPPWYDKALMVGAVWLSLAHRFTESAAALLIQLCNHPNLPVASRARVTLLLSLFQYGTRWELYPKLTAMLQLLMEQKRMPEAMFQTLLHIVRTRETDRIAQKMNEEIFPEIIKAQPFLRDKLNLDQIIGEQYREGKNPDWEDLFLEHPEMRSKLEELSKWQMEGADVFLTTFRSLKHFQFFQTPAYWFAPFYLEQPLLQQSLQHESEAFQFSPLIKQLTEAPLLCNSDKYSLLFSLAHIPPAQKEMMTALYSQELEQAQSMLEDEYTTDPAKKESQLANQYIQDLYRFFKVHPLRKEFEDIFNEIFDVPNQWFFKTIVPDTKRLLQLGEFYFTRDFYPDALQVFQKLLAQDPDQNNLIQKIAYCHQQMSQLEVALKYYIQADFLWDQNHWTKKKIALCYFKTGKTQLALNFYKEAEKLQPQNIHTKVSIANCYLELKNHAEALPYYLEVAYLEPDNRHVWRPIAWCALVLGRLEQSEQYYLRLRSAGEDKHHLMGLAHVYWCQNKHKDAVQLYHYCMTRFDAYEEFVSAFMADQEVLLGNGVSPDDLPLMMDQIQYLND